MAFFNTGLKIILPIFIQVIIGTIVHAQDFTLTQKFVASDRDFEDEFGINAVAIDGDIAFVGANFEDHDSNGQNFKERAGSVYVYQRNSSGNWIQIQKLIPSDRNTNDQFGISLSISGNYAVIGARYGDPDSLNTSFQPNTGCAYIFERQPSGQWIEIQKLVANHPVSNDNFGVSVSISGSYTIIGAVGQCFDLNQDNYIHYAGAAYIFERNSSGTWAQKQKLISTNRTSSGYYGHTVSIYGNTAIIGSGSNHSSGSHPTALERNSNGVWMYKQTLSPVTNTLNANYGYSVSMSNNFLIIGAANDNTDSLGAASVTSAGSAFIFKKNSQGDWIETQKIVASNPSEYEHFGISVYISGNRAIVGADGSHFDTAYVDSVKSAGAAYIFTQNANGQWVEQKRVVGTHRAVEDFFGHSVAISNHYAIVGSKNALDTLGTDSLFKAGAAYLYESPVCPTTFTSYATIECDSFTVPSATATFTNPGNFTVSDTIPNHCGGDSVLTIDVTILPSKRTSLTPTICFDDTIIINATQYHNSNTSGSDTISNVGPYNCDSIITISVTVIPEKVTRLEQTICPNDSIIINGTKYDSTNTSGIETFTNIGPYNCDSTVIINLSNYTPLEFHPPVLPEVCTNEQVEIFANIENGNPPYAYEWSYGTTFSTSKDFSFISDYLAPNYVALKVSDQCNIINQYTIPFYVNNCEIIIPNIITPNSDFVNDYFQIIGLEFYDTKHLTVYNRWGTVIFEQIDYLNNWDAYATPDGVYYFTLKLERLGVSKTLKGSLTILRN